MLLMKIVVSATIVLIGTFTLILQEVNVLFLKDYLHVPQISRNLIFVSKLVEYGYIFLFFKK